MAIQKYPYKVTKIDWYDYISRGETSLIFRFKVVMPNNKIFNYTEGGYINVVAFDEKNEKVYILPNDIINDKGPSETFPEYNDNSIEIVFAINPNMTPGNYFVQAKIKQKVDRFDTFMSINTVPTDKHELSFTVLDTEPYIYNDLRESDYAKKVIDVKSLKWPEEEEYENN